MRMAPALIPLALLAACSSGGGGPAVTRDDGLRASICTDAAAAQFGVARYDILILPPDDSGESVTGQAPLADNGAAMFTCRFDRYGRFLGLTRLS